ncbi:hypothetical protein B0H17DRAFT_1124075 [Mycena rosella]|uniref:Uncharacterized protein n=1 Tax=Mycena rosella TaxID=1033263 RepID=A0AAD7H0E0_MYCRO|nr:hypothetical protein B0H17DRAFT_1124075 [Mycena rosella]
MAPAPLPTCTAFNDIVKLPNPPQDPPNVDDILATDKYLKDANRARGGLAVITDTAVADALVYVTAINHTAGPGPGLAATPDVLNHGTVLQQIVTILTTLEGQISRLERELERSSWSSFALDTRFVNKMDLLPINVAQSCIIWLQEMACYDPAFQPLFNLEAITLLPQAELIRYTDRYNPGLDHSSLEPTGIEETLQSLEQLFDVDPTANGELFTVLEGVACKLLRHGQPCTRATAEVLPTVSC